MLRCGTKQSCLMQKRPSIHGADRELLPLQLGKLCFLILFSYFGVIASMHWWSLYTTVSSA